MKSESHTHRSNYEQNTRSNELTEIAVPFIDELLSILDIEKSYTVLCCNAEGILKNISGNDNLLNKLKDCSIQKGFNFNSADGKPNAVTASLHSQQAEQSAFPFLQHKEQNNYSCIATPVFDINNRLLGSVALIGKQKNIQQHTVGLVSSTAKAIENRLHNSFIQQQLFDAQQYAFSIMNRLSYGLIAVDLKNRIHWVNDTACRSINIRRMKLVNINISALLPNWKEIKAEIDSREDILDKEADLSIKNHYEKFIINAFTIKSESDEKLGYVITFRPFSRMLKLIGKYSGMQHKFTFDSIIHRSKMMKNLIDYAKAVANTPSTVLITGESGTGKEVFAQAIHNASERRKNNFVAINCGAITPSLIESELFGYEQGAFTDADKAGKPGKFEVANGGTLFLDEIGDMPLEMQVKLLRVLQEKTITKVGGNKETPIDTRIIAATNKTLKEEVQNGNFREDLFYRISVIPLEIPPLRERKSDIPPLFRYLLSLKADKLKRPVPDIENAMLKKIVKYPWPGNIRELENFAEKTVATDAAFGPEISDTQTPTENETESFQFVDKENLPSLADMEHKIIGQYLDLFSNNISKTASALGIGRNTLYKKMEKYGISI